MEACSDPANQSGVNGQRCVALWLRGWTEIQPANNIGFQELGRRQESRYDCEGPIEQWWTSFNDSKLNSLVDRAVKANLDLKLAAARVVEARAATGSLAVKAVPNDQCERFGQPQSSAGDSAAIRILEAVLSPIEFSNYQGGFDASRELDLFGRLRRDLEAANADARAADEARRAVLVTVLAEVGRSYIELRGLQLRLDIAERNINNQRDTLNLTEARAKAGLATEPDVSRAKAQLETTQSVVPILQSGIENSIHRLSVLLGEEPAALRSELIAQGPVPLLPPVVPVGLPPVCRSGDPTFAKLSCKSWPRPPMSAKRGRNSFLA